MSDNTQTRSPRRRSQTKQMIGSLIAGALIVAAVFIFVAIASDIDSTSVGPGDVTAEIIDFEFVPQQLEISVGDTVVWVNNDSVGHTVTEDGDSPGFDSGFLGQNAGFEFSFDQAGTFPYHCEIHPFITATVIVRDA